MTKYIEYKTAYEDRMKKYGLPELDNIHIWFNISDFAYPPHLILWDIAQGISHHFNLLSMIVESLVTGQIRYAALYEMKKLGVQDRKNINNMWGHIQAKLWQFNKINLIKDEAKIAKLILEGCRFWTKEYAPFAAQYYNLLENVWTAADDSNSEKRSQPNYYD